MMHVGNAGGLEPESELGAEADAAVDPTELARAGCTGADASAGSGRAADSRAAALASVSATVSTQIGFSPPGSGQPSPHGLESARSNQSGGELREAKELTVPASPSPPAVAGVEEAPAQARVRPRESSADASS